MFDFCKLDVYQKTKAFCILITKLLSSKKFDRTTNDQLCRASFSIMPYYWFNQFFGSGRFIFLIMSMNLGLLNKGSKEHILVDI
jgi:hypothetical protein